MWTNSLNKRSFAITKRFDFNENGWWRNSNRLSLRDARVSLILRRRSERKYLITTEASKTRYPNMVNRLLNIWNSVGHGDTMGRASSGPIYPPSTIPITHTSSIQHQEAKKTDTLPLRKLAGTLYASYPGYSRSKQRETATLYLSTISTYPSPGYVVYGKQYWIRTSRWTYCLPTPYVASKQKGISCSWTDFIFSHHWPSSRRGFVVRSNYYQKTSLILKFRNMALLA